jgi:hypothetical protein
MKKLCLLLAVSFFAHNASADIKLDSQRVPHARLNSKANQETRDVIKTLLEVTNENKQLLNQLNLSTKENNDALKKLLRSLQQIELSLNSQIVQQKKLYELQNKMFQYQLKKDKKAAEKSEKKKEKQVQKKTIGVIE